MFPKPSSREKTPQNNAHFVVKTYETGLIVWCLGPFSTSFWTHDPGCESISGLGKLSLYGIFSPLTLQKHVRKVVGGFGKKSCVTGVRKPGNTSMLNPNTTNQFNIISVISWQPVHLSMLFGGSFSFVLCAIFFPHPCNWLLFHINIVSKMVMVREL